MSKRFHCLYTSQKLKKKKSWIDGIVNLSSSGSLLTLYDGSDGSIKLGNPLEHRTLTSTEKSRVLAGKDLEIEFENYLVAIDASASAGSDGSSHQPSSLPHMKSNIAQNFKFKKFKPPSMIIRSPTSNGNPNASHDAARLSPGLGKRTRGKYQVDDEELDDIWNTDSVAQSKRPSLDAYQPRKNSSSIICDSLEGNYHFNKSFDARTQQQYSSISSKLENIDQSSDFHGTVHDLTMKAFDSPDYVKHSKINNDHRDRNSFISEKFQNCESDNNHKCRVTCKEESSSLDAAAIWGF